MDKVIILMLILLAKDRNYSFHMVKVSKLMQIRSNFIVMVKKNY